MESAARIDGKIDAAALKRLRMELISLIKIGAIVADRSAGSAHCPASRAGADGHALSHASTYNFAKISPTMTVDLAIRGDNTVSSFVLSMRRRCTRIPSRRNSLRNSVFFSTTSLAHKSGPPFPCPRCSICGGNISANAARATARSCEYVQCKCVGIRSANSRSG